MQTLCIVGRQADLGLAELESVLGADHIVPFGEQAALSDIAATDIPFVRLGGTIKLCDVLGSFKINPQDKWQQIEKQVFSLLEAHTFGTGEGKITCGLSLYGLPGVHEKDLLASGLRLKKTLKKQSGQSVRLVPNQAETRSLSTAQVLHNGILGKNGAEIVIASDGRQVFVGRTVDEQNITAYTKRDQNRPKRDARVGMLPPKLAQIILNLAVGKQTPPLTVLDPFCGTGVVLQEAALAGFTVYGTDIEQRMVMYSAQNLQWLNETHKLAPIEATLQTGDATTHSWDEHIDAVACEEYLGQPFSSFPSEAKLREVTHTCNQIAKGFLKNIAPQIAPGTRLCIALPAWHKPNGTFERLKLLDQLDEMGYNQVSFVHTRTQELLYYRPDQVVARDLLVIIRK